MISLECLREWLPCKYLGRDWFHHKYLSGWVYCNSCSVEFTANIFGAELQFHCKYSRGRLTENTCVADFTEDISGMISLEYLQGWVHWNVCGADLATARYFYGLNTYSAELMQKYFLYSLFWISFHQVATCSWLYNIYPKITVGI
jgi:hypothetical protein